MRAIIEPQSFGELERLVAQTLLQVARLGGDVLHVTPKQRSRLDSAIAAWEAKAVAMAMSSAENPSSRAVLAKPGYISVNS